MGFCRHLSRRGGGMSGQKLLLPPLTADEILAEVRRRADENRKTAALAKREELTIQQKVCERTAMELERIVYWIESRGSADAS